MASISQTAVVRPAKSLTSRGGPVDKYFYLAMGLLAAAIVVAGFSQTVMLLGVARDLLVDRRIHKVYLMALPCVFIAQFFAVYTWRSAAPWWMAIAHSLLG